MQSCRQSWNPSKGGQPPKTSLPATQFVDTFGEVNDIVFVHDQRGDDDLFIGRNSGLVTFEHLGHQLDSLVSELERLLDDSGINGAFLNARQGFIGLIEGNNLDLPDLLRFFYRIENGRTVIAP